MAADVTSFQCKKSFNGHGIGTCTGRIDLSLRDVERPLKAAEFRCEVLISYWWMEGREKRVELKPLLLSIAAERLGARFTNATILFETDLTSVTREPQEAVISKNRCEASWTS